MRKVSLLITDFLSCVYIFKLKQFQRYFNVAISNGLKKHKIKAVLEESAGTVWLAAGSVREGREDNRSNSASGFLRTEGNTMPHRSQAVLGG